MHDETRVDPLSNPFAQPVTEEPARGSRWRIGIALGVAATAIAAGAFGGIALAEGEDDEGGGGFTVGCRDDSGQPVSDCQALDEFLKGFPDGFPLPGEGDGDGDELTWCPDPVTGAPTTDCEKAPFPPVDPGPGTPVAHYIHLNGETYAFESREACEAALPEFQAEGVDVGCTENPNPPRIVRPTPEPPIVKPPATWWSYYTLPDGSLKEDGPFTLADCEAFVAERRAEGWSDASCWEEVAAEDGA